MSASLIAGRIVESGPQVVLAVTAVSAVTLVLVELSSQFLFGLDDELESLLAAGTSICDVSVIGAQKDNVVYAAATILVFETLTLVVYPAVGELLSIPAKVFGIWTGVTMFSTGPSSRSGSPTLKPPVSGRR